MKRLRRWLWLKMNKREPGFRSTMLILLLLCSSPGIVFGVFLCKGMEESNVLWTLAFCVTGLVFATPYGWAVYKILKDNFDVNTIHEAAIKSWHDGRRYYGLE